MTRLRRVHGDSLTWDGAIETITATPQNLDLNCSDSFKFKVTCGLHVVEPHAGTYLGGTGPKHISLGYQRGKPVIMYKTSRPLISFSLLLHLKVFCEAMQRDTIPF